MVCRYEENALLVEYATEVRGQSVLRLIEDERLRQSCVCNAQRLLEQEYDLAAHQAGLLQMLKSFQTRS